jgi:hypothetical protein
LQNVAKTIRLIGPSQRAYAHTLIDEVPDGYVCKIGEETRRDAQNRKLWPMLGDIKRQVPAMATFTPDQIKLRFLDAMGEEMAYLPKLEGGGFFPVGLKSSTLTVAQFSLLVELLYKFGAEHGVRWSEKEE